LTNGSSRPGKLGGSGSWGLRMGVPGKKKGGAKEGEGRPKQKKKTIKKERRVNGGASFWEEWKVLGIRRRGTLAEKREKTRNYAKGRKLCVKKKKQTDKKWCEGCHNNEKGAARVKNTETCNDMKGDLENEIAINTLTKKNGLKGEREPCGLKS